MWRACDRAAAETAQYWATEITSMASRHPKVVPLYVNYGGDVRFGRYKTTKSPQFRQPLTSTVVAHLKNQPHCFLVRDAALQL